MWHRTAQTLFKLTGCTNKVWIGGAHCSASMVYLNVQERRKQIWSDSDSNTKKVYIAPNSVDWLSIPWVCIDLPLHPICKRLLNNYWLIWLKVCPARPSCFLFTNESRMCLACREYDSSSLQAVVVDATETYLTVCRLNCFMPKQKRKKLFLS